MTVSQAIITKLNLPNNVFKKIYFDENPTIAPFTLVAGLLAKVPATDHLGTGFAWFPCVYKRMLRWFPRLQVATACFSCSPPSFKYIRSLIHVCVHVCNRCHWASAQLQ